MSFIVSSIIGAGASIFGSITQSNAEQQAQQQLAQQQAQTQAAIKGYLQPYSNFGQSLMPSLQSLITPGPSQNAALEQTPGFQFANKWGQIGVRNAQSTRGLGGNNLAAGAEFGTGLAQQTWQSVVDKLLAGTGIGAGAAGTAAGTTAQTAGAFAPAIAQTTIGQANALAGGAQGVSNSVSNALLYRQLFGGQYAAPPGTQAEQAP